MPAQPSSDSFRVEDFLEAIAAQLDRTQDALAFKAVTRPLTYALRDFSLQLQVFVELAPDGSVRFRSARPNEAGASTVSIGFTTITRPMIQENTVSLAMNRGPSLEEAGLDPEQAKSLERLGVRNANQLRLLGTATGASTVSRISGIPADRLRAALQLSTPAISGAGPAPFSPTPAPGPAALVPSQTPASAPVLRIPPSAPRLHLTGTNLALGGASPEVRLNGQALALAESDDENIVAELPPGARAGLLEVHLPDGGRHQFQLEFEDTDPVDGAAMASTGDDMWRPEVGR